MGGAVIEALVPAADEGAAAYHEALRGLVAPEAAVRLCHPLGDAVGADGVFEVGMAPLFAAFPDLERRDLIRVVGWDADGAEWIGACGYWAGRFAAPYLGIPPTGRIAAMRYHDFFRIEDGKIVEVQAVWDIPELMMQATAWPMGSSTGREWQVPGPQTQDGLRVSGDGSIALGVVREMLEHLGKSTESVEAMRLPAFWHPHCSWYGPAGIGTTRGIDGFRAHHQIPFLNALPDRNGDPANGHLFGQGDYVGFTGWPGMHMTVTGDGWLGIAPAGQWITMRSLDFWRVAEGKIRENWVLIDLLDVWAQLGVDVLKRMREIL